MTYIERGVKQADVYKNVKLPVLSVGMLWKSSSSMV